MAQKIIVLTGVSRGLGLAMTQGFIERGHVIWGCARGEAAVRSLQARWGAPHRFETLDVSDDERVRHWADACMAGGEVPDLLVNNAGLINRNANLWEVPVAEFDRVIDVNIKGVANIIRHFAPAMILHARGVIVNFSSGWGRSTSAEVAPYCASKWAIEGLTHALAQELPRGMAAVALNPGIINTVMLQSCFGASASDYPDADAWAKAAVPFILAIGPRDNGKPLTAP